MALKKSIKIFCLFSIVFLVVLSTFSANANIQKVKINEKKDNFSNQNFEKNTLFDFFDNTIFLTFSFSSPVISNINKGDIIFNKILIDDLSLCSKTGQPKLPVKPVNVLIPQTSTVESITISKSKPIPLGDQYKIELGDIPIKFSEKSSSMKENVILFDQTILYPTEQIEYIGLQNFRGFNILSFNLYPIQYLDLTGELYFYNEMTVKIKTKDNYEINSLFRNNPKDTLSLHSLIEPCCSSFTNSYLLTSEKKHSKSLVTPNRSYDYVIITNETLKSVSGKNSFQEFIDYKNSIGVSATIVTVEDINNTYSGVDLPEKIRNFIKDAYLNWGIEYVLLGGDVNIVPVRYFFVKSHPGLMDLWPKKYSYTGEMAADLYYGCLDGSFNYDGDEYWGEIGDGPDGKEVDLLAEVYVGRACIGNEIELNNFVNKTLTYEQTTDDELYLKNAVMAGENLEWHWGGLYKEEIINGSSNHGYSTVGIPYNYFNINRLYDINWSNNSWPKSEIINRINSGLNIINHLGHSGSDYNLKMNISDVVSLNNDKLCFIYSQGCFSGAFDNDIEVYDDCIAEYFTVKTKNAAFAGIWNNRYGWGSRISTDGASQRYDREFFDAIFNEGLRDPKKKNLGVANQDSKEDNLWRINEDCMRWCYYGINLFGDPQISLKPVPIPDHDLAVDLIDSIGDLVPNEEFVLHSKIVNQGSKDETDVSGALCVYKINDFINYDDSLYYSKSFSFESLLSGENESMYFEVNLPRGLYKIVTEINPATGEEIILNNNMSIYIFVGENSPPVKPATPKRHRVGFNKFKYSTSTNDSDGDKVYYKWFWGIDQFHIYYFSDWLGPYDSEETIVTLKPDYYTLSGAVEVISKDVYGALGEPSNPSLYKHKTTSINNLRTLGNLKDILNLIFKFLR